jgi:hypothetical protein
MGNTDVPDQPLPKSVGLCTEHPHTKPTGCLATLPVDLALSSRLQVYHQTDVRSTGALSHATEPFDKGQGLWYGWLYIAFR